MTISLIAAMSRNRIIGKNNDLPWHLPDDFSFFKEKTNGRHVILGRKNYESLPPKFRPLPNRTNLVLTRNSSYKGEGIIIFNQMKDAVDYAEKNGETELFIIGGFEPFNIGITIADRIYLTEIDAVIDGDTYFPEFDKMTFKETQRIHHPIDERHKYAFDFVTYQKD